MIEGIIFQFKWEVALIVWIQNIIVKVPFLENFFVACTNLGEPLAIVLILCFLYFVYDKKLAQYILIRCMIAGVSNPLTKNLFFRQRPYFVNKEIKCLKVVNKEADVFDAKGQGFSFPSGHSTYAASTYGSIPAYLKTKKLQVIATILVILTMVSRFALGVHYPTDVIVGALSGILVIVLFDYLEKKFNRNTLLIAFILILFVGVFYCKTDDYYQTYGLYLGVATAQLFETKYVKFKNTRNPLKAVIRMLVGIVIFLVFYKGIKLLIPEDTSTVLMNLMIVIRHMLPLFVSMGIYPIVFKYNILKLDDKMEKE